MAEQRLPVFPSRMNLAMLKDRISAAKTGHDLLKRKSDAIKVQLNNMLREIMDTKRRAGSLLKSAFFAHTEATWAAGSFNAQLIENVQDASFRVRAKVNNVAGVKLPVFGKSQLLAGHTDTIGLSKGGTQVAKARDVWIKALEDLVQLASLQTSVKTLDDALKVTNRRVNALEFVIMPMLYNTINYILSELDELEREDQYRIKKVKDLRTRQEDHEAETEEAAKTSQRVNTISIGDLDLDDKPSRQPTDEEMNEVKSMLPTSNYAVDALFS